MQRLLVSLLSEQKEEGYHRMQHGLVKWWLSCVRSLSQVKPQTPDNWVNWRVVCEREEKELMAWKVTSDRICASVMSLRRNVFQEDWIILRRSGVVPFPPMEGDETRTESFFTLTSEDGGKKWLPSVVLRANKDFSAVVPTTRDKCLTEGYSPSCGILMICSRHTPISLVVHEALWHTGHPGPSVRAQPYVFLQVTIMRSHQKKKKKKCKQLCRHWSHNSSDSVMTKDCCGLRLAEIPSTSILQFIGPKRINYVYLLILIWSCVHALKWAGAILLGFHSSH